MGPGQGPNGSQNSRSSWETVGPHNSGQVFEKKGMLRTGPTATFWEDDQYYRGRVAKIEAPLLPPPGALGVTFFDLKSMLPTGTTATLPKNSSPNHRGKQYFILRVLT